MNPDLMGPATGDGDLHQRTGGAALQQHHPAAGRQITR
jgi:hypothetical protein